MAAARIGELDGFGRPALEQPDHADLGAVGEQGVGRGVGVPGRQRRAGVPLGLVEVARGGRHDCVPHPRPPAGHDPAGLGRQRPGPGDRRVEPGPVAELVGVGGQPVDRVHHGAQVADRLGGPERVAGMVAAEGGVARGCQYATRLAGSAAISDAGAPSSAASSTASRPSRARTTRSSAPCVARASSPVTWMRRTDCPCGSAARASASRSIRAGSAIHPDTPRPPSEDSSAARARVTTSPVPRARAAASRSAARAAAASPIRTCAVARSSSTADRHRASWPTPRARAVARCWAASS